MQASGQLHPSVTYSLGEDTFVTHRTWGLVDVRAGLDIFETGKPFPFAVNQTMIFHVSSTWPSHSNMQTMLLYTMGIISVYKVIQITYQSLKVILVLCANRKPCC
jgi:hypothetical protein